MTKPSEQNEIPNSDELVADNASVGDASVPADVATETEETTDFEALRQRLAQAEKELLRGQADMENFRRRMRKDNEDRVRYAVLPLVTELVEIVDNLNRALESAHTSESGEGLVEGVKMVSQQIVEVLHQNGCKPIESVGAAFDPNQHEAIRMEPSNEYDANVVSRETRTGYTLHDRVVRPAQVFVSTGAEQTKEETQDTE